MLTLAAGHKKDEHLERAFWSRVSLNPPLYGADTDVSFFDQKVKFGWNMHDLGDLLKQYKVPNIPGVTTPMTYFGMWKVPLTFLFHEKMLACDLLQGNIDGLTIGSKCALRMTALLQSPATDSDMAAVLFQLAC